MSWMKAYVKMHAEHEALRTSWSERQKNLRALRARLWNDELVRRAPHGWR
jgi:hypothetical protein